jgi:hypothetical protein
VSPRPTPPLLRALAFLLPRTVPLPDGTVGYVARGRWDDCFASALATTLQVPIEQVPDPRIEERTQAGESPESIDRSAWQELERWLAGRGLAIEEHRDFKDAATRERWIGVVHQPGWFNDHCLVMCHDRVLFDPTVYDPDWARVAGVRVWRADEVSYGYSFRTARQKG